MTRLTTAFLLLSCLVPSSMNAAVSGAEKSRMIGAGLSIDHALTEALERNGVARIEVTLDLNEKLVPGLAHPAADSGVHPAVFDIAMMAAPGPMKLDQAGGFHLIRIAASETAIGRILEMKEVVALYLDTEPVEAQRPLAKSLCTPSTNWACLAGGYQVFATYAGVGGKVAASGTNSATYWAYSSNNWEVLARCSTAVRSTVTFGSWDRLLVRAPYSITVLLASFIVTSETATNKPIVNLQMLSCN